MDFSSLKVVEAPKKFLSKIDPADTGDITDKKKAQTLLLANLKMMQELQYKLFADGRYGVLIVIQGIDTAGKDGVFRHVMTALNPQGAHAWSFKSPSVEEAAHDYLWRIHKKMPARGEIAIFNRSHYEDVLVPLVKNGITPQEAGRRYDQINDFEQYLSDNNIKVFKFFLHISKKEQEARLLARLLDPKKHWKFDGADLTARKQWDAYMDAFGDMLRYTSTADAPWYVIPSDKKWFRNYAVAAITVQELESLDCTWPKASDDVRQLAKEAERTGKLPESS